MVDLLNRISSVLLASCWVWPTESPSWRPEEGRRVRSSLEREGICSLGSLLVVAGSVLQAKVTAPLKEADPHDHHPRFQ